jgi:uncharacterized protein
MTPSGRDRLRRLPTERAGHRSRKWGGNTSGVPAFRQIRMQRNDTSKISDLQTRATRRPVEALAGRAGRLRLLPLSQGERHGVRETFLDRLFEAGAWPPQRGGSLTRTQIMDLVLEGGYPEVVTQRFSPRQRTAWFSAYIGDVVSREALRPLVDVRLEREFVKVLHLLAARSAQELVIAELARDAELSRETTTNYVALLEALHLVHLLPAWATSATTRARRRPKIHLIDTGLTAHLAGATARDLSPLSAGPMLGPLVESFVAVELMKQSSWCTRDFALSHFRDRNGAEVDVIVEDRTGGRVVGIEIKAGANPVARDARHLARLAERLGDQFAVGIVLHTGSVTLPLGDRLWAVPIDDVWSDAAAPVVT